MIGAALLSLFALAAAVAVASLIQSTRELVAAWPTISRALLTLEC
jgi:hypothetical protein